jgi:hypothetical protein
MTFGHEPPVATCRPRSRDMREQGRRWSALPPDAAETASGPKVRTGPGLDRSSQNRPYPSVQALRIKPGDPGACSLGQDARSQNCDRSLCPFKNPGGCSKGKGSWSPVILRSAQRRADKWAGTPVPHYLTHWPAFASGENAAGIGDIPHMPGRNSGSPPGVLGVCSALFRNLCQFRQSCVLAMREPSTSDLNLAHTIDG